MRTATITPFRVESEIGPLRRVVVHRPGRELDRLTPSNADELLFDDIPWANRARQEHDAFVDALREEDVEVLEFGQLLRETLADPVPRAWVLHQSITDRSLGPALAGTGGRPRLRQSIRLLPANCEGSSSKLARWGLKSKPHAASLRPAGSWRGSEPSATRPRSWLATPEP